MSDMGEEILKTGGSDQFMLLQMQTQHSKMSFDLDPDAVGELIQAAFRYSSNMAQLQPGWSEAISYQDGQRAWDGQEVLDMPEEESIGQHIPDLEEDGTQPDVLDWTEPGDEQNGNQEDMPEPGRDQESRQCQGEGSLTHRLRIMDGSRMDPADRHQWTAAQIRILMLVPIQRHGRKISQKDSRHHRYSGPPRDRINHTRA